MPGWTRFIARLRMTIGRGASNCEIRSAAGVDVNRLAAQEADERLIVGAHEIDSEADRRGVSVVHCSGKSGALQMSSMVKPNQLRAHISGQDPHFQKLVA